MEEKKKILIIDDDENITEVLSFILEKSGYLVLTAHSGIEGFERYSSEKPDLVLLDLKMPDWDGITVLRHIRLTDARTPVVLMTGFATVEYTIAAFRIGVTDFVIKPFNFEKLLDSVENLLSGGGRRGNGRGTMRDEDVEIVETPLLRGNCSSALRSAGMLIEERLKEADAILTSWTNLGREEMERIIKIKRNLDLAMNIMSKLLDTLDEGWDGEGETSEDLPATAS